MTNDSSSRASSLKLPGQQKLGMCSLADPLRILIWWAWLGGRGWILTVITPHQVRWMMMQVWETQGNGKAIMNTGREKGRGRIVPPIRQASRPRK